MSDISGSKDLTLVLTQTHLEQLKEVETVVESATLTGDPLQAFRWVLGVRYEQQIRGVQIAYVLYHMEQRWQDFGVDDDFVSTAETETGLSAQTIKKYVRLYRQVFENENIGTADKQLLAGMPIKDLLMVAPALADGSVAVEDVVQATTKGELRKVVRDARGVKTSSETGIYIILDRNGLLKCRQGSNGYFTQFGFLNLERAKEDPVVQKAIDRLVQSGLVAEV